MRDPLSTMFDKVGIHDMQYSTLLYGNSALTKENVFHKQTSP